MKATVDSKVPTLFLLLASPRTLAMEMANYLIQSLLSVLPYYRFDLTFEMWSFTFVSMLSITFLCIWSKAFLSFYFLNIHVSWKLKITVLISSNGNSHYQSYKTFSTLTQVLLVIRRAREAVSIVYFSNCPFYNLFTYELSILEW